MLVIVLLIIAAVCFALAAWGVTVRFNLLAVGLFVWVLAALIPRLT